MKVLWIVFLAAALSACNPAYQRPVSADAAGVRFVATQPKDRSSSLSVYAHAGDACGTPRKIVGLGGSFNFGGGKKSQGDIGLPKDERESYVQGHYYETTVVAGQRFHFTVAGGEVGGVCYLSGSFLPEPGANYEVRYTASPERCHLSIDRIHADGTHLRRQPEASGKQRTPSCTFFWN